jgi:hypothetical protein
VLNQIKSSAGLATPASSRCDAKRFPTTKQGHSRERVMFVHPKSIASSAGRLESDVREGGGECAYGEGRDVRHWIDCCRGRSWLRCRCVDCLAPVLVATKSSRLHGCVLRILLARDKKCSGRVARACTGSRWNARRDALRWMGSVVHTRDS